MKHSIELTQQEALVIAESLAIFTEATRDKLNNRLTEVRSKTDLTEHEKIEGHLFCDQIAFKQKATIQILNKLKKFTD